MVVKDCNFSVQKGEMIGLMGESGSGKSTLAKLLIGLEKPSQGQVLLDGQPYSVKKSGVRILLVFQDSLHSVNPNFTVDQVLTEALSKDVARDEIEAILEDVGLDKSYLNQPARQLSGGQLQRICIARGLLLKPDILIFDEALSGLDPIVQGRLLRLLYDLWEKYQLTYIFISHDFKLSYALCHRILVMADGEIVDEINDFELPIQAHHPVTKKLIGDKGNFSSRIS